MCARRAWSAVARLLCFHLVLSWHGSWKVIFRKVVWRHILGIWWELYNDHFIANFCCLQSVSVKEFWKSVNIWWRSGQRYWTVWCLVFWLTVYIICLHLSMWNNICQSFDHWNSVLSSFCNWWYWNELQTKSKFLVSSANFRVQDKLRYLYCIENWNPDIESSLLPMTKTVLTIVTLCVAGQQPRSVGNFVDCNN